MASEEVSQLMINGYRVGIVGLNAAIEAVAETFSGRSDEAIVDALMQRLSKSNYIVPRVVDAYRSAFLKAYQKHLGMPVDDAPPEGHLQIRVLGPGCPNCDRLETDLMAILAELGIPADLEHVRAPSEIARYGVMAVPALVINGRVMAAGTVPAKKKLKSWLARSASGAPPL